MKTGLCQMKTGLCRMSTALFGRAEEVRREGARRFPADSAGVRASNDDRSALACDLRTEAVEGLELEVGPLERRVDVATDKGIATLVAAVGTRPIVRLDNNAGILSGTHFIACSSQ
jgi:hypothetical protein